MGVGFGAVREVNHPGDTMTWVVAAVCVSGLFSGENSCHRGFGLG